MSQGMPEPTNLDFSIAFRGMRLQAQTLGLDVNTEDMRLFLQHQAEVSARDAATIRELFRIINPS